MFGHGISFKKLQYKILRKFFESVMSSGPLEVQRAQYAGSERKGL